MYAKPLPIGGAPIAGKDEPEEVLQWIQDRITCRISEEDLRDFSDVKINADLLMLF